MLAGTAARFPPSRMRIVSVQTWLPTPEEKHSTSAFASIPSSSPGCGKSTIVRDG